MRSLQVFASGAILPAIGTAFAAALIYMLIARSIQPGSLHMGAAIVIGLTLGIHTYRRLRVRIASSAHKQQQALK